MRETKMFDAKLDEIKMGTHYLRMFEVAEKLGPILETFDDTKLREMDNTLRECEHICERVRKAIQETRTKKHY